MSCCNIPERFLRCVGDVEVLHGSILKWVAGFQKGLWGVFRVVTLAEVGTVV